MKKWKLIGFNTRLLAHKWLSYKLSMFYSTIEYFSPSKVEHMRIKCKTKVPFFLSANGVNVISLFSEIERHGEIQGEREEEGGRDGDETDWGLVYRIVGCCVKAMEEYCKNENIFISGIKT